MIGFRFSFISETSHDTSPHVIPINTDQTLLGDQEIKELLTNNTISTIHSETIPKSHIFSAIEGFRTKATAEFKKTCIPGFLPYLHLKVGELFLLEGLLQKNDRMWKIHLKDAYFSVTLNPDSPQFIKHKYTPHISGRYFNNGVLNWGMMIISLFRLVFSNAYVI